MSFVAKVFVVFNLIMSAFFLMFATYMWTANTKWQKMYEIEKGRKLEEVANYQKIEKGLAAAKAVAEKEAFVWQEQTNKEKLAKEVVLEEILKLKAEVVKASNDRDLANDERQEEARENKRLSEQVVALHKIITKQQMAVTVERNNAQTMKNQLADMESSFNGVSLQLGQANRDLKASQSEVGSLATKLQRAIERVPDLVQILEGGGEWPALEAKVLAVRSDVGMVMLSVGSQNKVVMGMQFTISKGSDYKARVQVDKIYPDMCSAKIVAGSESTKGLAIEPNDDAITHR